MANEWEEKFEQAQKTYEMAVSFESSISIAEREIAAKTFKNLIQEFDDGKESAFEILEGCTKSDNRHIAFRILVEMINPDATSLIVSVISESKSARVGGSTIRLLGKRTPLPTNLWENLAALVEQEWYGNRVWILEALLNHPTTYASHLVKKLLEAQSNSHLNGILTKTLAKWGEFNQLRQIIQMSSKASHYSDDIRADAAFYLALHSNDPDAIDLLISFAHNADLSKAARAVVKLAWLARPEAILPISKLLKSDDSFAAGFALGAARDLGTPFLGESLLYLAAQLPEFNNDLVPVPLADEAICVLRAITGQSDWKEEYIVDWEFRYEMELTQQSRDEAIAFYREQIKNFVPSKRYYHGEPITLSTLAKNLISPYQGLIWMAAYNLQAITGKDFGFDPDLDLISNLDAVIAWSEYAATSDVLETGGWAFNAKPLPTPSL